VIEVSCRVGPDGATPVKTAPLAPELAGLVSHVSGYEELAVEAALKGGADRVFRALLAHPLIGQTDRARLLTDRLIAANTEFLSWAR
jgi:6-phospho-beta-glucosidase